MHLSDDALDALGHDVVRDRAERIGQHDIERQVQRIEQGHVGQRGIGLYAEEGPIFDRTRCRTGNRYDIAIKRRAAITDGMGKGQGALTKCDR